MFNHTFIHVFNTITLRFSNITLPRVRTRNEYLYASTEPNFRVHDNNYYNSID